jgi:hypothetical protein
MRDFPKTWANVSDHDTNNLLFEQRKIRPAFSSWRICLKIEARHGKSQRRPLIFF